MLTPLPWYPRALGRGAPVRESFLQEVTFDRSPEGGRSRRWKPLLFPADLPAKTVLPSPAALRRKWTLTSHCHWPGLEPLSLLLESHHIPLGEKSGDNGVFPHSWGVTVCDLRAQILEPGLCRQNPSLTDLTLLLRRG